MKDRQRMEKQPLGLRAPRYGKWGSLSPTGQPSSSKCVPLPSKGVSQPAGVVTSPTPPPPQVVLINTVPCACM